MILVLHYVSATVFHLPLYTTLLSSTRLGYRISRIYFISLVQYCSLKRSFFYKPDYLSNRILRQTLKNAQESRQAGKLYGTIVDARVLGNVGIKESG